MIINCDNMHAVLYNYILYNYNNYIIVAAVINVIITIPKSLYITHVHVHLSGSPVQYLYLYKYTTTYSHQTVRSGPS